MDSAQPRRLFFTGTDTDVGKTYVAVLAVTELAHLGRKVAVYKPVASGCRLAAASAGNAAGSASDVAGSARDADSRTTTDLISDDAVALWQAAGCPGDLHAVCPQRFLAPLAPQVAAVKAGQNVNDALLVDGLAAVLGDADTVVVEGAGGLLSPLSQTSLNSDIATKLDCELVIVAANRLGVIHQVLACVFAAKALRLPVVGIVLNAVTPDGDESVHSNADLIRSFTQVPVLATLPYGATASGIDWTNLPSGEKQPPAFAQAWL